MKKAIIFSLSAGMMLVCASAFAIDANLTGVGGGVNVSGLDTNHAIVNTNNINGSVGTTDWTKFNIGHGETVTNQFNGSNQQLLFRVVGDPTKINGTWNSAGIGAATGKTTLINPAGVMVGNGASINLASLNISAIDAINKKAGNIRLEQGANINVNDLNVEGSAIYSGADLLGKSVKFSTMDGVNYDVIPGVEIGGVAKGDIFFGNSAYQAQDGSLVITSGNNLKFQNAAVKNANASLYAKGDIVVEAGYVGKDGNVDYSMDKRAKFDNATVFINSDKGNIYMNHIDNKNGSIITAYSKTGTINTYNNVNSGGSVYSLNNESGDIITQNLHNDGGAYITSTIDGGRNIFMNPDNNTASTIDVRSISGGEVYIEGMNNRGNSSFNVITDSQTNIVGSMNQDTSKLNVQADKGISINRIYSSGDMSLAAKDGYINIGDKSKLNGKIELHSSLGARITDSNVEGSNLFTNIQTKDNIVFDNVKGNTNIVPLP